MIKNFLLLFLIPVSIGVFAQSENDITIWSEYIVMLKPAHKVDELVKAYPDMQVKRCLSKQMNIWLLERNTTPGDEKLLASLQYNKLVKLAQFNHRVEQRSIVPDDPYFSQQWNMLNTGQSGGTAGDDIDATDAWAINHNNITANGDTIVIAVIDGYEGGGFDITHEDINFFVNNHEIPGNDIDDDNNGYIDDYNGWNAFDENGNIQPFGNTDSHAMHVSGIAAATGNNSKGVAGVCWGAKVLRVVGGSGVESQVVEAYSYVREMRRLYNVTHGAQGAFVVATNSSFGINGGVGGAHHTDFPVWCAMYDSMGAVGILSAAATANTSWNIDVADDLPTGCPSKFLISVTNTTNTDQLQGQAAWGDTSVDLGAPGTGIYSAEASGNYGIMTGTSMASPHVAGTVAAMFAAACPGLLTNYQMYPDSVALLIKQFLLDGTNRLPVLYNKTVTGGRLNLYNAIKNLDNYNCSNCNYTITLTATQPTRSNTCYGALQLYVSGNDTYSFNWSTGANGVSAINNLCPGNYSVTVTDLTTNCVQVKNVYLYKPDSIVVSYIHVIPVMDGDSGNIIVSASEGNYQLQYSLNGTNYQQASTLVISSNGNYTVYIKSEAGCVIQQNIVATGAENIKPGISWNLFPDPASSVLNISLSASQSGDIGFVVTNVLGQPVLTFKRAVAGGVQTIPADVSGLAAGSYFITLNTGNIHTTGRFVVAR